MILKEPAKRPVGHRALVSAVGVWTAAVAFAGPLLIYLLWLHPLRSAEIQATQLRSTQLREEIQESQAVEATDPSEFLREMEDLGLELAYLESILPSHPPSTQFPETLRLLAASEGVRLVRLEPEKPVLAGGVGVLPWRAELRGSLVGMASLIWSFEQTDLILKVTKLHLLRLGDGSYRLRLHLDSFYAVEPEP